MKRHKPSGGFPTLWLPDDFDAAGEEEARTRGLLDHVTVELADGRRFAMGFHVPSRVTQEAESSLAHDPVCFADPRIVMVKDVTLDLILQAVQHLERRNYFDALVPDPDRRQCRTVGG